MVLSKVKSLQCFLAALTLAGRAKSQITIPPHVIGLLVDEASPTPVSEVSCAGNNEIAVSMLGNLAYCEYPGQTRIGTACSGKTLFYDQAFLSAGDPRASSCDSCISVTLVEEWPAGGGTWTMIDCMRAMGLSEPVSTLYFNAPTDLKTSATESTATATSSEDPAEDDNDSQGGGSNAGVIAGAVIGSLSGIALISTAIFLLVRAKRRAPDSGELSAFKHLSLVWTSAKTGTGHKSLAVERIEGSRTSIDVEAKRNGHYSQVPSELSVSSEEFRKAELP